MPVRTIVVVEDEAPIASAVAARLKSEGFEVEIAADGPSGVELCEKVRPDLVVLDLMLPGLDGLEVCRRIQKDRPVPVVMLTARDSETDMLVGLAVGADDYLTKPFSPRELVARIHAVLRRMERTLVTPPPTIVVGDVEIEPASRQVRRRSTDRQALPGDPTPGDLGGPRGKASEGDARYEGDPRDQGDPLHEGDGRDPRNQHDERDEGDPRDPRGQGDPPNAGDAETVHLTPTEFDLLHFLATHPGVVHTRAQLLDQVWGWRDGSGHRTVDSHVRSLRRKLGAGLIRTVHGVGYALDR